MSHGDYPVNEESHSDREWNRRMLSKDREIDRLRAELADANETKALFHDKWLHVEAATARVRAVCRKDPWALDGEHTIKAVLLALEPNETIDTNRTGE